MTSSTLRPPVISCFKPACSVMEYVIFGFCNVQWVETVLPYTRLKKFQSLTSL